MQKYILQTIYEIENENIKNIEIINNEHKPFIEKLNQNLNIILKNINKSTYDMKSLENTDVENMYKIQIDNTNKKHKGEIKQLEKKIEDNIEENNEQIDIFNKELKKLQNTIGENNKNFNIKLKQEQQNIREECMNSLSFKLESREDQIEEMKERIEYLNDTNEEEIATLRTIIKDLKEDYKIEKENSLQQEKKYSENLKEDFKIEKEEIKKSFHYQIEYFKNEIGEYRNKLKEKEITMNKEKEIFIEMNNRLSEQVNKKYNVQEIGKIGEYDNLEILNRNFSVNKDIKFTFVAGIKESGDIMCELYKYTGLIDIKNHQKDTKDHTIRQAVMNKMKRDMKIQNVNFGILATASNQGFCNGKKDLEIEWIEGNKLLIYVSGLDNDKNKICRVILLVKDILDLKERNEDMSSMLTYLNLLKNMYISLEVNKSSISKCIDYNNKQLIELKKIEKSIMETIEELQKNNITTIDNNNKLDDLSKKQLQELCKEKKLKFNSNTNKSILIKLLR